VKAGYKYHHAGTSFQVACNLNEKWYERYSAGFGFTCWKPIPAPIIRSGLIKVETKPEQWVQCYKLVNKIPNLPQN